MTGRFLPHGLSGLSRRDTFLGVKTPRGASLAYLICLAALTTAAAGLRAARLDHPMRYDESWTFLFHAGTDDISDTFAYTAANNHVLHSLLVRGAIALAGPRPAVLRMPALLAGAALVPLSAELARRLSGRKSAGLIAAALTGGSGILIEYSINARGYSMLCAAAVVLAILTLELSRDAERRRLWIAWCATSAVGMLVIPIMVYPIAVCSAALALDAGASRAPGLVKRRLLRRLGRALLLTALLTLLLYAPVLWVSGLAAVLSTEQAQPRPISEVLLALPGAAAATLADWTGDTSLAWRVLVAAGLAWGAVLGAAQRRTAWLLPLLAAVVLAAAAMAHRVVPFPRVWLFVLPIVLAAAGAGLGELAGRIAPRRLRWLGTVGAYLAVCAVAALSGWRAFQRPVMISEDPRGLTILGAERIARDAAELADGHTALVWNPHVPNWPPLAYYSVLHAREGKPFISWTDPACRRVLIVVDDRHSLDETLRVLTGLGGRFGQPSLMAKYDGAGVYLAERMNRNTGIDAPRPPVQQ